ncbi:MAG: FadR/GntR family transcriptional regulator [Thermomicrobiales bacterium]
MMFSSVAVIGTSAQVAQQIEDRIRAGHLLPGQRLPSERDLAEQFGASRGIVREAIKMLNGIGILASRHGSGVYVCDDPVPAVSRVLTLSVGVQTDAVLALYRFREMLEACAAHDAARYHSDGDLVAMRLQLEQMAEAVATNDLDAFHDLDEQFHAAISTAAGNAYLNTVQRAVLQIQDTVAPLVTHNRGSIRIATEQHWAIFTAITAGDSQAADAAMRAHVHYASSVLRHPDNGVIVAPE